MSHPINLYDAKQICRSGRPRAAGEEIIIAKAGRPLARLVPWRCHRTRFPSAEGRIAIGADFDARYQMRLQKRSGEIAVRLLLDSHIVSVVLADDPALPAAVKAAIGDRLDVFVSAASPGVAIRCALVVLNSHWQYGGNSGRAGFTPLRSRWSMPVSRGLPRDRQRPSDRMLTPGAA